VIVKLATGKEMVLFGNVGSFTASSSHPRHSLGISVAEASNQPGLIVTEVVDIGNAAMYGIEKGDVIVAVNGRTPQSGVDLMEAVAQTNRSSLSLGIMSKTREYFEFEFPIPFRRPEVQHHYLLGIVMIFVSFQ
jgi:S1-C subfamily serine protease